MNTPRQDRSNLQNTLGKGVYFAASDYARLPRRLAIVLIDGVVLVGGYLVVGSVLLTLGLVNQAQLQAIFLITVWFCLAVLKPTIRTPGYWITGCRVVTLRGRRPSVARMTFRLLLCLLGPFTPFIDLFWASVDEQHQTLRDRFAGTCVVRNRAVPVGTSNVRVSHYHALSYNLTYASVPTP